MHAPSPQLPPESKGLAERAYHPEEINANPALRVDTQYYLAQQVCGRQPRNAQGVGDARRPAVGVSGRAGEVALP